MKVDLERLRASVRHVPADGWSAVRQPELEALLAVVDAAREVHGCGESDCPLCAALEPFTPTPADRAWEAADRWNADDLAAAIDAARGNPRDRARDQLADAGVVVQRQFRADQERIAELERERDEWKGRHKAVTNGLSNHVARADQAEEQLARVPMLVKALRGLVYVDDGGPTRLRPAARRVRPPELRRAMDALAEWEKP